MCSHMSVVVVNSLSHILPTRRRTVCDLVVKSCWDPSMALSKSDLVKQSSQHMFRNNHDRCQPSSCRASLYPLTRGSLCYYMYSKYVIMVHEVHYVLRNWRSSIVNVKRKSHRCFHLLHVNALHILRYYFRLVLCLPDM